MEAGAVVKSVTAADDCGSGGGGGGGDAVVADIITKTMLIEIS
jgi:hypothetical protein